MTTRGWTRTISVPTDDEAQERFYQKGWTDGLPIVPPTPERVSAMVQGSGLHADDQVVAAIPPGQGAASIEGIAVNAVMAGCQPAYMPLLVAAVEALVEPQFNLNGIQATTNPAAPLLLVNGPIRGHVGINSGSNCMGQGVRANASVGRAVRLILQNIGGAVPGDVDKATQGMPGKYGICFGENEEESPWPPLHVERGFPREESVVTVMGPQATWNITFGVNLDPTGSVAEDLLATLGRSMIGVGLNNFRQGNGEPLLVLCPQHANLLAEAGLSKEDVKRRLHELSSIPLEWLPPNVRAQRFATAPEVDPVPFVPRWEDLIIVVAGGPGGLHSTFLPTFGETIAVSRRVQEK